MNLEFEFSKIVRNELKPIYDLLRQLTNPNLNSTQKDEYIDLEEFCKRTGYKPSTVAQLRHKKRIPYHRVGGSILYKVIDVEKFIADSRKESLSLLAQQASENQRRGRN